MYGRRGKAKSAVRTDSQCTESIMSCGDSAAFKNTTATSYCESPATARMLQPGP